MKTIFTVGAVVLATCLLSGCVNEQKVNQLASNVQTLNAKIARLEQDMIGEECSLDTVRSLVANLR